MKDHDPDLAPRPPLAAIALVSATALAYEILLVRLFSIIQWHHFAYMIISLAMLGYGASGTFLTFFRQTVINHYPKAIIGNIVLFSAAIAGCFPAAQHIPFNPEEILWNPRQLWFLLSLFLLLALPFFFAANTVAMSFFYYRKKISRIYAFDLAGAGIGSLLIVAMLFLFFPMKVLQGLGAAGLLAAALAWWELRLNPRSAAGIFLVLAGLPFLLPGSWTRMVISPYKPLQQQLQITGSRVVTERSGPLGLLTVVESPVIPFRYAPGMSLLAQTPLPDQLGVFFDGGGMTAINNYTGARSEIAFLDQKTSALPYHLLRGKNVLILGGGGGSDVLQALYHETPRIDVVEINPQLVELVREDLAAYTANLLQRDGVRIHIADGRGYLASENKKFDLIQCSLLDSFGASSAGLSALAENYLYTREAFQEYLEHLHSGGFISITRWIKLPPRDSLKLITTAAAALRSAGVADPGKRLVLIRSWQTSTLLIKNGEISGKEIGSIRKFCRERAFDTVYYPGISQPETNRFNIVQEDNFYRGVKELLGPDSKSFIQDYKFHIAAATDDAPYFFHFFKWRSVPDLARLSGQGGMALLEWGYLVLVATLGIALPASLVIIVSPLLFLSRRQKEGRTPKNCHPWRIFVYFYAIGLAFLFLEIAFIQKFILFLSHPLYATAVVITAFLIFAGLGSAHAQKNQERLTSRFHQGDWFPFAGIILLGLLYLAGLPQIFKPLMGLPDWLKSLVSAACIAPLAFCMGKPFPAGLTRVSEEAPQFLPWAWAVNGCASVQSSVLATLIAIQFGFKVVVLCALALYGIAGLIFFVKKFEKVGPGFVPPN